LEENAKLELLYNQLQDQMNSNNFGEDSKGGNNNSKILRQANHKLEMQIVDLLNDQEVFKNF
jgi:hypothetical protein